MSGLSEGAALWGIKALGAVAGSAISVAYILPKTRREAAVRFAVGLVSGLVFGGAAGVEIGDWLGLTDALSKSELMLTGSAAASLCAWWALGAVKRFAGQGFQQKSEDHD
jgi:Family of unknown function (DUF6107)